MENGFNESTLRSTNGFKNETCGYHSKSHLQAIYITMRLQLHICDGPFQSHIYGLSLIFCNAIKVTCVIKDT
jgi:hypothetical protein